MQGAMIRPQPVPKCKQVEDGMMPALIAVGANPLAQIDRALHGLVAHSHAGIVGEPQCLRQRLSLMIIPDTLSTDAEPHPA